VHRFCSCLCALLITVTAAPATSAEGPRLASEPELGERVRVLVARQYHADRILVGPGRIDAADRVVDQDGSTLTVLGPDGRMVRYPRRRARIAGRLTGLDRDWLTLSSDDGGPVVRVPRRAVDRLEVSLGRPNRARGAAKGLVFAGIPLSLAGFVLTSFRNFSCEGNCHPTHEAFIGGAVGMAIGVGLGVALENEKWRKVSLRVGLEPRPGHGVAGGVSLRF
jgi:hypothetical protein